MLTSCLGARIRTWDTGKSEYHGAMDISANNGTPILASQSGEIYKLLRESESGGYGNMVMIKHGEVGDYVYYTLYAHMNSYSGTNGLNLKVGDKVEAGQVIGYVGNTGDSDGNHLHFELIPWPKSDNNGQFRFNKKKYNLIEPIYYIQRGTIPEHIINQSELPGNCGDMTSDEFGQYANESMDSSSADASSTGTTYDNGKMVFSKEIATAISNANYSSSKFNKTLTSVDSYYKTTAISNIGGTAYSARSKPNTNNDKDAAIKNMSDLEILARTIYAEQGSNSEEAGILVGITILNKAKTTNSIAQVLTGKYNSGTQYNYNCVSDNIFWGSIPQFAKELAIIACAAVEKGSYSINGVECISVEGFHAGNSIDNTAAGASKGKNGSAILAKQWWGWNRYLVLNNSKSGSKYTAFYGW